MSVEYSVRRASAADFAAVLAIERECPEASHWSEEMWRSILDRCEAMDTARTVWIAERLGGTLGFAVVQYVGDGAELEVVAVRAEARRKGVASGLCEQAIAWASSRCGNGQDAAEMHLEVRAGNAAALRLYAALGFVEQGRRRAYYRDPVEDAVVMARALQPRT